MSHLMMRLRRVRVTPLLASLSPRGVAVLLIAGVVDLGAQEAALRTTPARGADSAYRAPAMVMGTGPGGATIRCRDGSHPAPNAPDIACQEKGGVLLRYPVRRQPARATTPTLMAAPSVPRVAEPVPPARVRPTEGEAIRAPRPPTDATLMCGDGTFVRADTASARCGAHGGVKIRFQPRKPN